MPVRGVNKNMSIHSHYFDNTVRKHYNMLGDDRMEREKAVREPRQTRSIQLKEKILDTAYSLMCTKGYYNTTTNEIAKAAGVSIGSLYSYFADKETIFLELQERYHKEFLDANEKMLAALAKPGLEPKQWIRELIDALIHVHDTGRELNREIQILSYTNPKVAALKDEHMAQTRAIALECIHRSGYIDRFEDYEATALVAFEMTSGIVDYVAYEHKGMDPERILSAAVEALSRFLVGP